MKEQNDSAYSLISYLTKEYEGLDSSKSKHAFLSSLFGWYMQKKSQLEYNETRDKERIKYDI